MPRIESLGIGEVAVNVSEMVKGGRNWTKGAILSQMNLPPDERLSAFDKLCDVGLIWDRGGSDFVAGIPSLASHVVERRRTVRRDLERLKPELPNH